MIVLSHMSFCSQQAVSAVVPRLAVALRLLATPLRTMPTPLLSHLQSSGRETPLGSGFLSLDQSRRVVCLLDSDRLVAQLPVVGVWVDLAGVESAEYWQRGASDETLVAEHPLILAAVYRFLHGTFVHERVFVAERTLLVMVVHSSHAAAGPFAAGKSLSFFEATCNDSEAGVAIVAPGLKQEAVLVDVDAPPHEQRTSSEGTSAALQAIEVQLLPLELAVPSVGQCDNPEEDVPRPGQYSLPAAQQAQQRGKGCDDLMVAARPAGRAAREQCAVTPTPTPPRAVLPRAAAACPEEHHVVEEEEGPRSYVPRPTPSAAVMPVPSSPEMLPAQTLPAEVPELPCDESVELPERVTRAPAAAASIHVERPRHTTVSGTAARAGMLLSSADELRQGGSSVPGAAAPGSQTAAGRLEAASPASPAHVGAPSEEVACLRQLVTAQQAQMSEMQKQLFDLSKMMASFAMGGGAVRAAEAAAGAERDAGRPRAAASRSGHRSPDLAASLDSLPSFPRRQRDAETMVGTSLDHAAWKRATALERGGSCEAAVNTSSSQLPTMTASLDGLSRALAADEAQLTSSRQGEEPLQAQPVRQTVEVARDPPAAPATLLPPARSPPLEVLHHHEAATSGVQAHAAAAEVVPAAGAPAELAPAVVQTTAAVAPAVAASFADAAVGGFQGRDSAVEAAPLQLAASIGLDAAGLLAGARGEQTAVLSGGVAAALCTGKPPPAAAADLEAASSTMATATRSNLLSGLAASSLGSPQGSELGEKTSIMDLAFSFDFASAAYVPPLTSANLAALSSATGAVQPREELLSADGVPRIRAPSLLSLGSDCSSCLSDDEDLNSFGLRA
eukprot:TRINITY_DN20267_c0_g1_i6.p1 TRINITY_DN20267_c0_g1~~TRINITY_DN20267_c0_g1_i6.p1  ORF type:complete len:845 (+),score=212.75 TRINITY_DN20267_c0_g1_i6:49-2583(+)